MKAQKSNSGPCNLDSTLNSANLSLENSQEDSQREEKKQKEENVAEASAGSREEQKNSESDLLETEKIVKAIILSMMNSEGRNRTSNSDESSNEKAEIEPAKPKRRRRRRRARKRKGLASEIGESRDEPSLAASEQLEPQCVSSEDEFNGQGKDTVKNHKSVEESGSEISQDEFYQNSIRREFIIDSEQRLIKENLLNENEKLNEVVTALEEKLSTEIEKSTTLQKSLKQRTSDNRQFQRQKLRLQKTVEIQIETIENLEERIVSLKKTCDNLSREKLNSNEAKNIELDTLKNQLKSKDNQLKLVEEENKKRSAELTKNHEELLTKISDEARGMTEELSKVLGSELSAPGETNCIEAFGLLQKARRQLATLSQKTISLQETVKGLKENVESQAKTSSKLSCEKKSLKEEIFELNKQNKTLVKGKAKLQREIDSLKTDSVKAKNLSQSFKTRMEELKANIRSIRREKETVIQQKQNAELKLKELGIDNEALKKELRAKKAKTKRTRNRARIQSAPTNRLITPKVQTKLKGLFIKSGEERDDLETSLSELEHRKKEGKEHLRTSDAVREYLKRNSSRLVQKHEKMCKQSERWDKAIAKMASDGGDLKRMVRRVVRKNERLEDQADMFIDELNCGYMERCALKKALDHNCMVLARYADDGKDLQSANNSLKSEVTETTASWMKDVATLENLREELRKARKENEELKSERRKHERSRENYKELIRGYSRVANRSSEIHGAVNEMKAINRELLRFVAVVQRQKEMLSKKVNAMQEETNLIQAMYHKLKGFSGKQSKKILNTSLESNNDASEKSLQAAMQGLREKLQMKRQLIASLKLSLDAERSDGDRLREKVQTLLSNEQRVSLQLCALKMSKKTKRSSFMNFKKRKSENDQLKGEAGSLNEKQLSILIQLVLSKQELTNEIKESLEMETRLCILLKHGEEYTELLHTKCFDTVVCPDGKTTDPAEGAAGKADQKEMAELLKERKRLENELAFKEAHEGLMDKQIALLRKQKKRCTKALRKFEEELDGVADQSIIQSMVDILTTSSRPETRCSDLCEEVTKDINKIASTENLTREKLGIV